MQDTLTFSIGRKSSTGCLFGNLAGSVERETEFALQEVALILQNFAGLSKVTIHLPPEESYDETHFYTTAPHMFSSVPNLSVPGSSPVEHTALKLADNSIQNSKSTGCGSIMVSDTHGDDRYYDNDMFRLIPYHSFLTIPQSHLNLLRRWIPGFADVATPSVSLPQVSGQLDRLIHDDDASSDGLYSCSSHQRVRSQSDSLVYGRIDLTSEDMVKDIDGQTSARFRMNEKFETQESSLVRSNSEVLMRLERSPVRPSVLILWGSTLHFWHQMNPFMPSNFGRRREDEIEWSTDLFDDEDDDDFDDEEIQMEVKNALEAHHKYG